MMVEYSGRFNESPHMSVTKTVNLQSIVVILIQRCFSEHGRHDPGVRQLISYGFIDGRAAKCTSSMLGEDKKRNGGPTSR